MGYLCSDWRIVNRVVGWEAIHARPARFWELGERPPTGATLGDYRNPLFCPGGAVGVVPHVPTRRGQRIAMRAVGRLVLLAAADPPF